MDLSESLCDIKDIKIKVETVLNNNQNSDCLVYQTITKYNSDKNKQRISKSYEAPKRDLWKKSKSKSKSKSRSRSRSRSKSKSKKLKDKDCIQVESIFCEIECDKPCKTISIKRPFEEKNRLTRTISSNSSCFSEDNLEIKSKQENNKDVKLNFDIVFETKPRPKIKQILAHVNYDDHQSDYNLTKTKSDEGKKSLKSVKISRPIEAKKSSMKKESCLAKFSGGNRSAKKSVTKPEQVSDENKHASMQIKKSSSMKKPNEDKNEEKNDDDDAFDDEIPIIKVNEDCERKKSSERTPSESVKKISYTVKNDQSKKRSQSLKRQSKKEQEQEQDYFLQNETEEEISNSKENIEEFDNTQENVDDMKENEEEMYEMKENVVEIDNIPENDDEIDKFKEKDSKKVSSSSQKKASNFSQKKSSNGSQKKASNASQKKASDSYQNETRKASNEYEKKKSSNKREKSSAFIKSVDYKDETDDINEITLNKDDIDDHLIDEPSSDDIDSGEEREDDEN